MISGNPQQYYNNLMQNNPQFARFVQETKGMTPEEVARKYNINPIILNLLK